MKVRESPLLSSASWPYLATAAVLPTFEPTKLVGINDAGRSTLHPVLAMLSDSAEPVEAGPAKGEWRLRDEVRRRVFAAFPSADDIREAIRISAPNERKDDPTRAALRELLTTSGRPPLSGRSLEALLGLDQAVEWLTAAGISALPSREEIHSRIQRQRLLEPMRRLASGFEGREDDLAALRRYVNAPQSETRLSKVARSFTQLHELFSGTPPFFIFGPGGSGKSTLISRFILEHADGREDLLPFILLDFDRSVLDPRKPDSLMDEIVGQLRAQFHQHEDALRVMDEMLAQRFRAEDEASPEQSSHFGRSDRVRQDLVIILNSVAKETGKNILLVVDTFEIVQRRGPTAVYTVLNLIGTILSRVSRLRVVLVGRAELRRQDFPFTEDQITWEPWPLKAFNEKAGRAYLRARLRKDLLPTFSDVDLDKIVRTVRGNPLGLRLAARVLDREGMIGIDGAIDKQQLDEAIAEEQLQGMLYARIIEHLDNGELQKIASPGLIVRRITTEVIREVLAGPCEIDLLKKPASDLFGELQREGSLVEIVDDATVKHRSDVRQIMLSSLRRDLDTLAERIDHAAVEYWQGRPTPAERAEEIYHRLWRNDSLKQLENAWIPEAAEFLEDALDEFQTVSPGDWALIWLSEKLGRDLPATLRRQSSQVTWERDAQLRARPLLADGKPDETLRLLSERRRSSWTADSALWMLEIQALLLKGNAAKALFVATEALDRAKEVSNARHLSQLFGARVSALERLGKLAEAEAESVKTLEFARKTGDKAALFASGITRCRIASRVRQTEMPEIAALRTELATLASRPAVERSLAKSPALLRESIGVLGPLAPELIADALEQFGIEPVRSDKSLLKLYTEIERGLATQLENSSDATASPEHRLAQMIRRGSIERQDLEKIANLYSKFSEKLGAQVLQQAPPLEALRIAARGSVLEAHPHYRTAIGVLGIMLPVLLILSSLLQGQPILNSISTYYYTSARDWFVGTLFVLGVFLFFYQYRPLGESAPRSVSESIRTGAADAWLGKLAGLSAILVALLPTTPPPASLTQPPRIGVAHGVAATVLFVSLSLFPLLLFSQSRQRGQMYRSIGWSMIMLMVLVAAFAFAPDGMREALAPWKPVLLLETLLIWAFGISWFTKGQDLAQEEKVREFRR